MIIDCKAISEWVLQDVKTQVEELKKDWKSAILDIVGVGGNVWCMYYAKMIERTWAKVGVQVNKCFFEEWKIDWEWLKEIIIKKNIDSRIDWIILLSPMPKDIDLNEIIEIVAANKDIDGMSAVNQWLILQNNEQNALISSAPVACIKILESLMDSIAWLDICLIWAGKTVGRPLSALLTNRNATVTTCHQNTKDITKICKNADIVISAVGKPQILKQDMIKKDAIVIDVGISQDDSGNIVWDVDFENVKSKAWYITPVPWWVWPITLAVLFENLVKAIKLQKAADPFDISLNNYLELCSSSAMPWWWGLSAITWIQAANMVYMVCNLTKWHDEEVNSITFHLDFAIKKLKWLYNDDMEIFNRFLEVYKLPKESQDRSQLMESTLKQACNIPLQIAQHWIHTINLASQLSQFGNKHAKSDILTWIHLWEASIKSSIECIKINLESIKDSSFVEDTNDKIEKLLGEMSRLAALSL